MQAARYQMIVMFIIASTTAVASAAIIILAAFWVVDTGVRLRSDRLLKRDKARSWSVKLQSWSKRVCLNPKSPAPQSQKAGFLGPLPDT